MLRKPLIHLVILVSSEFYINFSLGFSWDFEDGNFGNADLVPSDRLVFVGETLKMVCTLKDSSSDMNSVYFTISPQIGKPWLLPKQEYFIDGLSVTVNITVYDNFTESTTVECQQNETLKSTFIYVERPIPKITEFSAVYLYQEHISFSWPWTMQNLSTIIIEVSWSASNTSNKAYSQECHLRNYNSCRIPFEEYAGQNPIYVTFNTSPQKWDRRPSLDDLKPLFDTNATFLYKVNVLNNTKSGPPENLAVISKNQTCFEISWKDPIYLLDCSTCKKFYQIDVLKEKAESSLDTQEKNNAEQFINSSLVICDLQVFTKYKVNLRVKGGQPNPWSDPASISLRTNEDTPLSGPLINSTNYYIQDCVSGKRKVYIYWKEPPVDQVQGSLTNYEVQLNDNKSITVSKGSNHFQIEIECNVDYNVSVFSVNSVGRSLSPSVIWIPGEHSDFSKDFQFKVEEVDDSISSNLKNITITWNSVSVENVNLVIYRCEEDYQQNFCLYDYTLLEVSSSINSVQISSIDVKENLIGFALKSKNRVKQGILWTECIFKKEKMPEKPVGLQVYPRHDGHSLVISWVSNPCNKITKVFIQYYNICISDIEGHLIKWILKNGFENNYTIESLLSNEEYVVKIQGITPYNITGPFSDFVQQRTQSKVNDSSLTEIILPIVFSVVFFFIVLFGGYHLYRLCKKSRGRFIPLISTKVCEDKKPPDCNGTANGHSREISRDSSTQVNKTHGYCNEISRDFSTQVNKTHGYSDEISRDSSTQVNKTHGYCNEISRDSSTQVNKTHGYSNEISRDSSTQVNKTHMSPVISESPSDVSHMVNKEPVNNTDMPNEIKPQDSSYDKDVDDLSDQHDHLKCVSKTSETAIDDSSFRATLSVDESCKVSLNPNRSLEEQPILKESQDKIVSNEFKSLQEENGSVLNAALSPHYSSVVIVDDTSDNTASNGDVRDTIDIVQDTSGHIQQGYVKLDICSPITNTDVKDLSGHIQQDYVRLDIYSPITNTNVEDKSGFNQSDYSKLNIVISKTFTDVFPSGPVCPGLQRIY